MGAKCKINMVSKVLPVEGSVSGLEGKETGACPECGTPGVMLSVVGGFVRAHEVAAVPVPQNNPTPPLFEVKGKKVGKGLSEAQTGLTDTGVRVGDPRAAEKRRAADLAGATGTGTVKVPRKVDTGKKLKSGAPRMATRMTEVEATEAHVREALEYWRTRRITDRTPDSVRRAQVEQVSMLARMLEAMLEAQEVRYDRETRSLVAVSRPVVDQPALRAVVDTAAAHRGPTLVRGRAMNADEITEREVAAVVEGYGGKAVRPTCDGPLGRERADKRIITVPEPAPKRTASERRRYRRMLKASNGRQG